MASTATIAMPRRRWLRTAGRWRENSVMKKRINYKAFDRLAEIHQVTLTRDCDEDGPCVHVHGCFMTERDAFLRAVDAKWPGKYHREWSGDMSVWLRVL